MKPQISQNQVWEEIAEPWKTFRVKPVPEVAEFLKDKKGKILDLGCGSGRNFTKTKGKIYGVDFSNNMLKFAKAYAQKKKFDMILKKAEVNKLPFKDNSFDAAIFIAVLHCIPDERKRKRALKELLRVLKPDSEALITVWDKNQKRFRKSSKELFIPWRHSGKEYLRYYHLYDKKELLHLLKEVGFEIVEDYDSANPLGLYSRKNIEVLVRKK